MAFLAAKEERFPMAGRQQIAEIVVAPGRTTQRAGFLFGAVPALAPLPDIPAQVEEPQRIRAVAAHRRWSLEIDGAGSSSLVPVRMHPGRPVFALQELGGFRVAGDLLGLAVPVDPAAGVVGNHRQLHG